VISSGRKFLTIAMFCPLDNIISDGPILSLARNQRGWSWILTIPNGTVRVLWRTSFYALRFMLRQRNICYWQTKLLPSILRDTISLRSLSLVHKGYRAISGRVEFNPLYRKPQAAALHLDYSRTRINDRWSIIIGIKLSPLPMQRKIDGLIYFWRGRKTDKWKFPREFIRNRDIIYELF